MSYLLLAGKKSEKSSGGFENPARVLNQQNQIQGVSLLRLHMICKKIDNFLLKDAFQLHQHYLFGMSL